MNFKTLQLGILAALLFSLRPFPLVAQTSRPTPLTIDQSPVSIRVDGHLEDWPSARMILLDQHSQVVLGKTYWKGPADFSGRVFLTYDSQFLYVAAIVWKQGSVTNNSENLSLWNGDCLELYLSIRPKIPGVARLDSGDYLLGFSPGSGCNNPRMYCFNRNKEILGGRLVARQTKTGYVMEACVPLFFFDGIEIGPGKMAALNLALDEGGPLSGNRIVQLDLSGYSLSRENPSVWSDLQWVGKTEVSVPVVHEEDVNAQMVQDGTKGANYLGKKILEGQVLDPTGKPLVGAHVTTWPKTQDVLTDKKGNFKLDGIKLYDKTFLCGRLEGFAPSVSPSPRKGPPATIRLWPLPKGMVQRAERGNALLLGQTVNLGPDGDLDKAIGGTLDGLKPLKLKFLRLTGMEAAAKLPDGGRQVLDQFVSFARQVGAEPMIEVPVRTMPSLNPADWVKYCNIGKKYNVRYWTIGDEPDMADPANYSVYDYINDYRVFYNGMKEVDPSIFVLGPELAWKYADGDNDWLTPFLKYNGDITDMVSVHHYVSLKAADYSSKAVQSDLRNDAIYLQNLTDRISGSTDHFIPLVVTGTGLCREDAVIALPAEKVTPDFWNALWTADKLGMALMENLGLELLSRLKNGRAPGFWSDKGPQPAYWALKLFSDFLGGKTIPAQIQQPDMSVYANQDPKTKDVNLLIVNKSDMYYRPNLVLNGKEADLTVDAGLDQRVDYEIPSFSISLLKIKADKSPGQKTIYQLKMAQAGKEPEISVLKPW